MNDFLFYITRTYTYYTVHLFVYFDVHNLLGEPSVYSIRAGRKMFITRPAVVSSVIRCSSPSHHLFKPLF
jgi:hypothetical protein